MMDRLNKCVECQCTEGLTDTRTSRTRTIAGLTFQAELSTQTCPNCGTNYYGASVVEAFEMGIAVWLAEHGINDGEAMRVMRSAMHLKGVELATLLDVTPETISRWEKEHRPPDRLAVATLAAMVLDRVAGHDRTLQRLRTLQNPPPTEIHVALTLAETHS